MRPVALLKPLLLAMIAVSATASMAAALEQKKYDAAEFKAAQEAGKPAIVHVTAPWCPTCKAQHEVLDELAAMPDYASVTLFQVDFDSQKDVVKGFKATSQSTLIAYSGANETGRLVGQTNLKAIETLVASSMKK
jgi:thiol-disulfide isomerase/thioredoxin